MPGPGAEVQRRVKVSICGPVEGDSRSKARRNGRDLPSVGEQRDGQLALEKRNQILDPE
jgi:hypothetical protein